MPPVMGIVPPVGLGVGLGSVGGSGDVPLGVTSGKICPYAVYCTGVEEAKTIRPIDTANAQANLISWEYPSLRSINGSTYMNAEDTVVTSAMDASLLHV